MCFNCKSKGSLNQTVAELAAKKTVPRIFFKNRQNLPDTFLLELRKKKNGSHRARFCSANKSVSDCH